MSLHPLAGKPAPQSMLIDVEELVSAFYALVPDPKNSEQAVSFGTSGHRGTSTARKFNEAHVLAATQAICLYRRERGLTGPMFVGKDTHALSEPAEMIAVEVLAANGIEVRIHRDSGYTPTPVISHAILAANRHAGRDVADGIVFTPSHNPPEDGGIKYNPPEGGPADAQTTQWIACKANEMLEDGNRAVKRIPYRQTLNAGTTVQYDFITPYVQDLRNVVDMEAIAASGLRIGADALGGSGLAFWDAIAEHYSLDIESLHDFPDPTFSFMCLDHDGKIRMDCSSPYAMAGLIELKDRYDIAFGNDPDFDRHGIVTPGGGLLNPNHYLAVAISYLFQNRPGWRNDAAIGKTVVSSSIIDRIAQHLGRRLSEVPVGFKWFVDGLIDGSCGFGGEESAGASFVRTDGTVWTTDKDGIILNLLAAEITATTGKDPWQQYRELTDRFGNPAYERIDEPATPAQKAVLKDLSPEHVPAKELAGEPITAKLTQAPGNGAAIGGLKVTTASGWFAARPSGTEDIYKIYAESFKGPDHLKQLQVQAREIVGRAFAMAGVA